MVMAACSMRRRRILSSPRAPRMRSRVSASKISVRMVPALAQAVIRSLLAMVVVRPR